MVAIKAEKSVEIFIPAMQQETIRFKVIGNTPLIVNRISEKAKRELLAPKGRKTAADKASSMKHNPIEEFRAAAYTLPGDDNATYLAMPSTAFKGAMRSAAIDVPGAAKTQIGRLTFVRGEKVPIFGIPKLHMSITRSADMNKTPDVRTRCIVPRWATEIEVTFTSSIIKAVSVFNLLSQAGVTIGVGDWRGEKGSGTFGQFRIVPEGDKEWEREWASIALNGGRDAQIEAMKEAIPYDDETEELLSWFNTEVVRRGFKVAA